MRTSKAPGVNRIPSEFYKYASLQYKGLILKFFNNILVSEMFPDSFSHSIIFPFLKKGDRNDVNNYWGISFLSAICELFSVILLERIRGWVQVRGIIPENQAGFRTGYSAVDNIFILDSFIKYNFYRGKKVYSYLYIL